MSEPTGHQGDSTRDVIPNEHCPTNQIRTMLTPFGRHQHTHIITGCEWTQKEPSACPRQAGTARAWTAWLQIS